MIRLFDVSVPQELQEEIEARALFILRSKQFILGESVATFETQFAEAFGACHAVGVASGTDALVLALRALGIGPGDEVIVPALSFYASAEAVLLVGAEPVLVDVNPVTLTLSPEAAAAALTSHTAALMPVHLYGHVADMPRLAALAERHQLALIEDAAQAVGATLDGKPVGSWSDACCYSFYPTKNLGAAGDGGMITTPHPWLAEKVRQLRVHAQTAAFFSDDIGYTSRLDALQAEILSAKLPHLAGWNEARREVARAYHQAFADNIAVTLPHHHEGHVYHLYVLHVPERDRVLAALQERGIEARVYYPYSLAELPPLHGRDVDGCPNARRAVQSLLALPMHPNLSEQELACVSTAVNGLTQSTQFTR